MLRGQPRQRTRDPNTTKHSGLSEWGGCYLPVYAASVVQRGRLSRSLKANQADQRHQSDDEWPDSGWKRTAVESNNRIASLSKCQRERGHHDRRGGPLGDGDHEDHGENNRSDKCVSSGWVGGRSEHVCSGETGAYERVDRSNDHQGNGRAPYGDPITLIQDWSAPLT